MILRSGKKTSPVAVAAVVVAAVLAATSCTNNDAPPPSPDASRTTATAPAPSVQQEQAAIPLAETRGKNGLLLTITEVRRSSGGFLTVSGALKNPGEKTAAVPAQLRGNELEIVRNGQSLGGATLVDTVKKKVYYVLRDTEGRPLTTTGLSLLKAGETAPVYVQFPAPPTSTADAEFRLPTFTPVTLQLPS